VLQTPGFKFVNLQYGECEVELREAEEKYGVEILRWPDLNLKDDLDNVFSIIRQLDFVISVQTAVLNMAACCGSPTFGLRLGGWTNFSFENPPWLNNIQSYTLTENLYSAIARYIVHQKNRRNAAKKSQYSDVGFELFKPSSVNISLEGLRFDVLGLNSQVRELISTLNAERITETIKSLKSLVIPMRHWLDRHFDTQGYERLLSSLDAAYWSPPGIRNYLRSVTYHERNSENHFRANIKYYRYLIRMGFYQDIAEFCVPFLKGNLARNFGPSIAWELSSKGEIALALEVFSEVISENSEDLWTLGNFAATLARDGRLDDAEKMVTYAYKRFNNLGPTDLFARIGWVLADLNMIPEARYYFERERQSGALSSEWQRNEVKLDLLEKGVDFATQRMAETYEKNLGLKDGFSILGWVLAGTAPPHFVLKDRLEYLKGAKKLFLYDLNLSKISPEWQKNYSILMAALADVEGALLNCSRAYLLDAQIVDGLGFCGLEFGLLKQDERCRDLLLLDYMLGKSSPEKTFDLLLRMDRDSAESRQISESLDGSASFMQLQSIYLGGLS
jgi:tetratricopeptide (TPR) repeat protein